LDYGVTNVRGRVSVADAAAILDLARASGIDTLDTATAYGDSESVLGDTGIAAWRVISKLPAVPDTCSDVRGFVADAVRDSLSRLRIERLHALLLHRPLQLLTPVGGELYVALQEVRDLGLVGKIGVSVYGPEELDAVVDRFPPDLVQAPLNVLDRRLVESGWLAKLHGRNIEVHVRSAFLQGLLLTRVRPKQFARWRSVWDRWEDWLKSADITPLQACLHFVQRYAEVDRIVVGVDSVAQLREIIHAAAGSSPRIPDDLRSTDAELVNPSRWGLLN
jgi:aryl-alcohol dehydrogenase-like predicted oxidoreductase